MRICRNRRCLLISGWKLAIIFVFILWCYVVTFLLSRAEAGVEGFRRNRRLRLEREIGNTLEISLPNKESMKTIPSITKSTILTSKEPRDDLSTKIKKKLAKGSLDYKELPPTSTIKTTSISESTISTSTTTLVDLIPNITENSSRASMNSNESLSPTKLWKDLIPTKDSITGLNALRVPMTINGTEKDLKKDLKKISPRFVQEENVALPLCPGYRARAGPIWHRDAYPDLKSWQKEIKSNPLKAVRKIRAPYTQPMTGGIWKPLHCNPDRVMAILVPFRNRSLNLYVFLKQMHPFLQQQNIHYQMFVVEQKDQTLYFNKGRLFNMGFRVAHLLRPDISCFIMHDVDMIPEDERMIYWCDPTRLIHMGAWTDTLNYTSYDLLLGGVVSATTSQFKALNGYSNMYWGWGGEDDDFGRRSRAERFKRRREPHWYRYTMLSHQSRYKEKKKTYRERKNNLAHVESRYKREGLNTIFQDGVRVEDVIITKAFVHVVVDVGFPDIARRRNKRRGGANVETVSASPFWIIFITFMGTITCFLFLIMCMIALEYEMQLIMCEF